MCYNALFLNVSSNFLRCAYKKQKTLIKCSVYIGGVFITLYLIYSLFELEESLFFVESAAVSHQSAVAAYHPVTGIIIDIGLALFAEATARTALGLPIRRASSLYDMVCP